MLDTSAGASASPLKPPSFIWPLALLLGVLFAIGALNYAPGGRINVLWLWLLWSGLPFIGSLVSLVFLLFGRDRPWLFRWRRQGLHWYPSRTQRWHMLALLQLFWLWVGLGLVLGFWLLLLLTDLAFGWSSTLLAGDQSLLKTLQILAAPWQSFWPAAVPDAALLEATRFVRIAPQAPETARAGDWWPFLMASLLCYNLLPRALLAGVSYWRWGRLRRATRPVLEISSDQREGAPSAPSALAEAAWQAWETATTVSWELESGPGPTLGIASWAEDQRTLDQVLAQNPQRLLWQVAANRSPVGEMADLIARARDRGIPEQGLLAITDAQTQVDRHLVSWQRFAQQQQLTWVVR